MTFFQVLQTNSTAKRSRNDKYENIFSRTSEFNSGFDTDIIPCHSLKIHQEILELFVKALIARAIQDNPAPVTICIKYLQKLFVSIKSFITVFLDF